MIPPDIDPLTRLQGCLVAEGPLFRAGGLLEGHRTYPTLLASEWVFQDGDAGVSS